MKSITTSQFWKLYDGLPEDVKNRADSTYELWQINPHAHGLYFKRVGKKGSMRFPVVDLLNQLGFDGI